MKTHSSSTIGVLLLLLGLAVVGTDGKFLAAGEGRRQSGRGDDFLPSGLLNRELDTALAEALGDGHGLQKADLEMMRTRMQPTFDSLHKNRHGRVELAGVRYMIRRYFAESHGWAIKGFEKEDDVSSTAADAKDGAAENHGKILKQKLPGYVEAVLEGTLAKHGFGIEDAITMAATLERLVYDGELEKLERAYTLNGIFSTGWSSRSSLRNVLTSFSLMYTGQIEGKALEDRAAHTRAVSDIPRGPTKILAETEVDLALNAKRNMNPFKEAPSLTFPEVAELAGKIVKDYGVFQNEECGILRTGLKGMDTQGSGRIPINDFSGKRVQDFLFAEPESYLRTLGVLDESDPAVGPQVLVANYVRSLSNCVDTSDFYAVCCLDTCSGVMQTLEQQVRAPTATVEQLVAAMAHVSTDLVEEPRNLTKGTRLREMLEEVGVASDERINLHGRLMAQFLHYAYPHECPYPQVAGASQPKTVKEYMKTNEQNNQMLEHAKVVANTAEDMTLDTEEEEQMITGEITDAGASSHPKNAPRKPSAWSMTEELETVSRKKDSGGSSWTGYLGFVIIGGILLAAKIQQNDKAGTGGLLRMNEAELNRMGTRSGGDGLLESFGINFGAVDGIVSHAMGYTARLRREKGNKIV